MPVNAPVEYFRAEERFHSAKTREEKIIALEDMIRLLPKHHGSETMHAQLKSRLAKLKKESRKAKKTAGIAKEGEAQVCLIGKTQSGKSYLLRKLTNAVPQLSDHPYTTTEPEVGMMDYNGVKIQLVEIPATFSPAHMSIARTADAIVLVVRNKDDEKGLEKLLSGSFIRGNTITVSTEEKAEAIKEKIWNMLGLIVAYTQKRKFSPMALPKNSTVKDFAQRVHKDFVRDFRFARIIRDGRIIQAGLNYKIQNNDVVDIHRK